MEKEQIKLAVLALVRAMLDGKTPEEKDVPIFINEYLPPKIKQHLANKLPPQELQEIPNDFYMELISWLEKNLGLSQLNDDDLFQKIENKVYSYLRSKAPGGANFHEAETDMLDSATVTFNEELHSLAPEKDTEENIIDEPELNKFKEWLHKNPQFMIDQIERDCGEPEIKKYLIATFPTIAALKFLVYGNTMFMAQFQCGDIDVDWTKINLDLKQIEIFDSLHGNPNQRKLIEKIKTNLIKKGQRMETREILEACNQVAKQRTAKFGYEKPTKEARLTNIDKDINTFFKQFLPLYYAIQKKRR
jgi:hypothetical protein